MKKIFFVLMLSSVFFTSCSFINKFDNYVESCSFENANYSVMTGSLVMCKLVSNPSDGVLYYDCDFVISDTSVCRINDSSNEYVIVEGLKSGSSVITGKINNKECKAIISVYD